MVLVLQLLSLFCRSLPLSSHSASHSLDLLHFLWPGPLNEMLICNLTQMKASWLAGTVLPTVKVVFCYLGLRLPLSLSHHYCIQEGQKCFVFFCSAHLLSSSDWSIPPLTVKLRHAGWPSPGLLKSKPMNDSANQVLLISDDCDWITSDYHLITDGKLTVSPCRWEKMESVLY